MLPSLRLRLSAASIVLTLAILDGASLASSAESPGVPSAPVLNVGWDKLVDEFIESYFAAQPAFAVSKGRHEFDGQLPDWTAAGIQKEIARLERLRERALAFPDAILPSEQRFQRDYLVNRIDNDLFWMSDARQPFTNPTWYFYSGLDPSTYVSVSYAPAAQRARALIRYLRQIPAAAQTIRVNLRTPMPRTFLTYGAKSFGGFADFYRNDVPQAFADLRDERLRSELTDAIEPAARAMQGLGDWFRAQERDGNEAYALGPERFAAMLAMTEGVTTPLSKLEAIGRADLERNLAALNEECQRYVPAASTASCVAKISADKPQGGAVEGARQQLAQLRAYIVDHEIVSIPGSGEALVMEAPAYRRQNAAYMNIPGPYETNLPSVYRIAPPDPTWSKVEQDAYIPGSADLLFTSVHEVWPGHFLQFLHSNRASWQFGRLFVGYAFAEGWAHYAEELMVEKGLAQGSPEKHIGQLLKALLRDVRFTCAIGLHTQGMTVSQCEQMFKEKAFLDPGNARQQAARGTYDPAYLNYTLGKLMIRKLRDDWSASRGGERAWKQFNDEFLSHGGPPIPLLRSRMLGAASGERF